jgi:hypothetical protein
MLKAQLRVRAPTDAADTGLIFEGSHRSVRLRSYAVDRALAPGFPALPCKEEAERLAAMKIKCPWCGAR